MTGNTNGIQIQGLVKRYGDFTAVSGIDLNIPDGCIFALLGPNGSGKTTTVRMLTGLLWPDEGDALVGGCSVRSDPRGVKRRIGVLPDGDALFPRITLLEHLRMEGLVRGLSEDETERRAEDLLRYLDLWEKRHVYADEGSVGMRKKLGIALALIHGPDVLVMDEPFEGLDPIAAARARDLVAATAVKKGTTVFLTSHLLALLDGLVDEVALISEGHIVRRSTVADMRLRGETLQSMYLAAFRAGSSMEEVPAWLV
ncbi:MAG: ABC transporter ATP-binding protein [Acidobacteriota bacterium]|nr:ABC transporter ATP-binding protein [Acidobacteriota bacterium]